MKGEITMRNKLSLTFATLAGICFVGELVFMVMTLRQEENENEQMYLE